MAEDSADETQLIRPATGDYGALQPGASVGRYEIVSVLGQGGFGITYRARDVRLERDVAIKEYLPGSLAVRHSSNTVLPRSTQMAEDFTWGRARFLDEAKTIARFANVPAIVRIHEFLEANGTAYVVMPLLEGETLEARLKREKRLHQPAIERILYPLLDGLEQIHDAGFLHRDIKPANIILSPDGSPTLIDFGASRVAVQGRTHAMTAVFTPGYAPLEQFASGPQGPWTDIYALAATLYACITGKAPPNAVDRVVGQSHTPAIEVGKQKYAPSLLTAIDAGLTVKAENRPQSIDEWRGILSTGMWSRSPSATTEDATIRGGPPSSTSATTPPAPPSPPGREAALPRRARAPWLAVGAAVVALVAGGSYWALTPREPPQSPAEIAANLRRAAIEAEKRATESESLAKQEAENRRLLEEQRANSEAAARSRIDEEARRKAELEALSRQQADERARIERERTDASAREKAEAEAKLKELDLARRAAEEERAKAQEAREKAEADAKAALAALDAQRAAAAEARRNADEERAKADAAEKEREAQAARTRGEDAKKKAEEEEVLKKAADEEKARTEAAARSAEDVKRAAEREEQTLRLGDKDRQRIQVALTSLGFDTRGSDGVLGPRSREMITAWQQKTGSPATGFLSTAQQQALLRAAAPALVKFDDEQKRLEEERARAAALPPAAPAVVAAPPKPEIASAAPPAAAHSFDGDYALALNGKSQGTVKVVNGTGAGGWRNAHCQKDVSFTVTIAPTGDVRLQTSGFNAQCLPRTNTHTGRINGSQVAFNIKNSTGQDTTLSLTRR